MTWPPSAVTMNSRPSSASIVGAMPGMRFPGAADLIRADEALIVREAGPIEVIVQQEAGARRPS
jgi:hypothetical protein